MTSEIEAGEWIDRVLPRLESDVRSLALGWHSVLHGRELRGAWESYEHLMKVLIKFIGQEAYEKMVKEHDALLPHGL